MEIRCPAKLLPIYSTTKRFICLHGGRGSSKSWGVADFLLVQGVNRKCRILCCREIQNSIKDSVHKLLSDRIETLALSNFYTITDKSISGANGTEFIFKGFYRSVNDIKSTEGIDYAWVEEAQSISQLSLDVLIPTVRKENSQIIFTLNPTNDDDPVYIDYVLKERDDTLKIEINYNDNPFFPQVLRYDMEYDRAHDIDKYLHVWEGKTVKHSDAQIFKGKWFVEEFEAPDNTFFYFGADFGFGPDPATLNRCYVNNNCLYLDYEYHGLHIELNHLPEAYATIPESVKYPIMGDNSRPDTISYIRNHGFPLAVGEAKTQVEDGIAFLKSYEKIIIHPRCKHTIDEFRLYSYVTDKRTGLISNAIEDKNNHHIDAIRYALNRLIKQKTQYAKVSYDGIY